MTKHSPSPKLPQTANPIIPSFNLHKNALISIVGGGGKTTLLFALAAAWPGQVVITTTTRIFAAQMKLAPAVLQFTAEAAKDTESFYKEVGKKLDEHGRVLIVGQVIGEKAHGVPADLPAKLLARDDVDLVLVEADGSRMRPIKAPADHEPVIPPETTHVMPVVGIDALDKPLAEVAHRPELVAEILGYPISGISRQRLTPQDVARLILHDNGGLKGVPQGAQVIPVINKVETAVSLKTAREIAREVLQGAGGRGQGKQSTINEQRATNNRLPITKVVISALKSEQPIREVHQPVTAVILAAGQSKRMGQTKQLLPWGDTTVLGQTIRNVKETAVHDILVITGHDAEKVEAIIEQETAHGLWNTDYATTEMITSLQTSIRNLPQSVSAVLVMLADQPMVEPETIDQILAAYWQGHGDLIAPSFDGKRGNPVLIGRAYFDEILLLPPDDAPRTLLKRHADKLHLVPVNSDSILQDLDEWDVYLGKRPFSSNS